MCTFHMHILKENIHFPPFTVVNPIHWILALKNKLDTEGEVDRQMWMDSSALMPC